MNKFIGLIAATFLAGNYFAFLGAMPNSVPNHRHWWRRLKYPVR